MKCTLCVETPIAKEKLSESKNRNLYYCENHLNQGVAFGWIEKDEVEWIKQMSMKIKQLMQMK